MTSTSIDNPFRESVKKLFESCGVTSIELPSLMSGCKGIINLDGSEITINIMLLHKSRYVGEQRMGSTHVGYRMTLEMPNDVPVRFSIMHAGISGSALIQWVNRLRRIRKVRNDMLSRLSLDAWSSDCDWGFSLLDDSTTKESIDRLMYVDESDANVGHPCIFIHPGTSQFFRRGLSLDAFKNLSQDLEDFCQVLQRASSIETPIRSVRMGKLEKLAQKNPLLVGGLVIILALGFFALIIVGFILLVAVLSSN